MPERIPASTLAQMREAYLEHRTCEAVAKICDVAWHTVEKYRVDGEWDKLCERVDRLAEDCAVKKIGKRRADNIRIAQAGLIKIARGMDKVDELPFSAADVDRLSRLIEFLSGDPDSRPGSANVPTTAEDLLFAFARFSGADQDRILRQLRGDLVEPTQSNP